MARSPLMSLLPALALLGHSALASAQDEAPTFQSESETKKAEAAAEKQKQQAVATGKTADGVPRDVRGVQGISPFWEQIKQGDNAYIARSFDQALESYKAAIAALPHDPIGHLRVAEVHLQKGQLPEAEQALVAALRFVGTDIGQKAKIFFLLAEVRERKLAVDEAIASWTAYEKLQSEVKPPETAVVTSEKGTKAKPPAPVRIFGDTAVERKKRLEEHKKLEAEYASVKERIAQRLKEADERAKANAK